MKMMWKPRSYFIIFIIHQAGQIPKKNPPKIVKNKKSCFGKKIKNALRKILLKYAIKQIAMVD